MAGSRKEMRRKKKAVGKAKFFKVLALVLILGGVGVLGYSFAERYMVTYRQAQLREEYEATAGLRGLFEGPEKIMITEFQPMRLVIPSIDVDLIVIGDVDLFNGEKVEIEELLANETLYKRWVDGLSSLLDKGPVYYQLSDLPSNVEGNVVIAAHRAGRWMFFRYLDELVSGDEIFLDVGGYRFVYHVDRVEQVAATDWSMFYHTEDPSITLQTCTPLNVPNPPFRLNARGVLQEVVLLEQETPEVD